LPDSALIYILWLYKTTARMELINTSPPPTLMWDTPLLCKNVEYLMLWNCNFHE